LPLAAGDRFDANHLSALPQNDARLQEQAERRRALALAEHKRLKRVAAEGVIEGGRGF